jgi:hypothetical protein
MKTVRPPVLAAVVLVTTCCPAPAATIHVPGDQPTIQAGLDAATFGDSVVVASGAYTEHDILMKSGVCLVSETMEADCVTVDAQGLGRGFICDQVDASTTIAGLTITGGLAAGPQPADCGGGMYCFYCSPALSNLRFEANEADWGGGLCCYCMASPSLEGCVFEGNLAVEFGGGIYCYYYSSPLLVDCTFRENAVTYFGGGGACCTSYSSAVFVGCAFVANYTYGEGAGLICIASSPSLTDCLFDHNEVSLSGSGAGISCRFGAAPTLKRCTITGHEAPRGAGMYCEDSAPFVMDCTFENGDATRGAGISCSSSPAVITGSLFLRNHGFEGGALYCSESSPTLKSCTLVENRAGYPARGAGIHAHRRSSPTLKDCIIAFSTEGGAVYCENTSAVYLSCCDVYGNVDGNWTGCIADQYGVCGNICANPLFCGTLNPDEPYSLDGGSPCAPMTNPECGLIGAFDVGCGVTTVEDWSWGAIKGMFR